MSDTLTVVHRVKQTVRPEHAQQLQSDHSLHQFLGQRFQRFGRHLRREQHIQTQLYLHWRGWKLFSVNYDTNLLHFQYTESQRTQDLKLFVRDNQSGLLLVQQRDVTVTVQWNYFLPNQIIKYYIFNYKNCWQWGLSIILNVLMSFWANSPFNVLFLSFILFLKVFNMYGWLID